MDTPVSSPALLQRTTSSGRRRSPISLTPLIDVVFILLVFFMLASSFQDWRAIELDAPERAGASSASLEGALLVEVLPDGLRLSSEPVSLDALAANVGQRVARQPDVRVLVKPVGDVVLQDLVRVIDALAAAGVTEMSLVTDPNRRASSRAL